MIQNCWGDRLERGHGRRIPLQNGGHHTSCARPFKRTLARSHLVHNGTEGEDVAARVGLFAFDLLRRHVLERPEDGALRGQIRRRRRQHREARTGGHGRGLGESEVEQLCTALRDHDVARLQITVHDARTVRLVEGTCDLNGVLQRLVERQPTFFKPAGKRFAFEILHHEERGAAILAYVVQRADVRVIERGNRARFAIESFAELWVRGEVRGKDFDCYPTIEPRVASEIDLAHPSRADERENFVSAKADARRDGHGTVGL